MKPILNAVDREPLPISRKMKTKSSFHISRERKIVCCTIFTWLHSKCKKDITKTSGLKIATRFRLFSPPASDGFMILSAHLSVSQHLHTCYAIIQSMIIWIPEKFHSHQD